MTNRVSVEREIFLNGERYPLGGDGRVRTIVTSQYPQKLVLGDVDKDSNPRTSIIVWDDWSGGLGLYSTDGKEGLNRSAFSLCETRFKGHLTLHKLQTAAADLPDAGNIYDINELAGWLYATLNTGTDIYYWRPDTSAWQTSTHVDLPSASISTDSLNFRLGGTLYVAFAHSRGGSGGYSYSSNGSSFTDDTKATKYLTFWDERLWGIYGTQLWFSLTIGNETDDAVLSLPWGAAVTGLFTGPDAAGEEIIYASTSVGLYAHDAANARFIKTGVTFPASTGVKGATWNSEIYVSAEGGIVYRYDPTRGVVMSVGLDRDAGLPSAYATTITNLLPTHTGLLAVLSGTGTDTIWEYNGQGWHFVYKASAAIDAVHVSSADEKYRLYLASGSGDVGVLQYRSLDIGNVNPDIATISYEGTNDVAIHETPWFNAGQNEIDKTAIRVRIECTGMTADETVKVEYALNYSGTYESASTSGGKSTFTAKDTSSNGVTAAVFPKIGTTATPPVANTTSQAGVDFRAIRFKLTLNRGSTATLTPNVKSISLEWRRKIPAKYGFEFTLDRSENYGGKTPKEMKTDIITAIETSAQVEFTFVDDDGNTQNYYVDVTNMEDVEDTGHGEIGQTRIAVVEA